MHNDYVAVNTNIFQRWTEPNKWVKLSAHPQPMPAGLGKKESKFYKLYRKGMRYLERFFQKKKESKKQS